MRGASPPLAKTGSRCWLLIPVAFDERVSLEAARKGIKVASSGNTGRIQTRNDLAWAISVGGIGTILFAALLVATWYFASTLFLIYAGALLGVALLAMSNLLGRVTELPHPLRLAAICLLLLALLSGAIFLGGATRSEERRVGE